MTALTIPCTCIRCGGELKPITSDDPHGWVNRERRLVVECHCGWAGVIVVELVDLLRRRSV